MAYTESDLGRIIELIKEIEARKAHKNAAATYRDVPALKEIDGIVNAQLARETPCDRHTLADSIFAFRYLGVAYEGMGRVAYAVEYYKKLLELQRELLVRFSEADERCADDYYTALRARNYYNDDACADLAGIAAELLPPNKREDIEKRVLELCRPLRHDPVELTDEYLAVIDEVERRMEAEGGGKAHPLAWNERFRTLLKEYGVEWRPMSEFNRGWHFD
ncbi:MAG: hypothetical protein IJW21_03185 [Clostridia bacterium]|nr:hypothetical protein [Clostridia bacterium]